MRRHRGDRCHRAFVRLSAAVVLLVGACSATQQPTGVSTGAGDHPWTPVPGQAATTPAPGTATTAAAAGGSLTARFGPAPLDAFLGSADDAQAVASADGLVTAACMRTQGFTYQAPPAATAPTVTAGDSFLGVSDLARAQTYGYQVTDPVGLADKTHPTASAGSAQDHQYFVALLGAALDDPSSSDDGCAGKATAALSVPTTGVDLSIQGELAQQAQSAAESDAAVVEALRGWRVCMSAQGYSEQAPLMPHTTDVEPADVTHAVTDVGCKTSSGLTDTYIGTLYRVETDLIAAHRTEPDAYQAWLSARAAKARQVLAAGS